MGNDKTNMIIAVVLSLAVLLGWNYFVSLLLATVYYNGATSAPVLR